MSDIPQARLGRISYINVLPIYHPMDAGVVESDFETFSGPPAALNALMREGKLDVSSCSSIEYAANADEYLLVPDLAIGSQGHVRSVLMLSREPIAALDGKTVLVSSETNTSAALLRLFLKNRIGVKVNWETGSVTEQIENGQLPDAFLAIGDEALRLAGHPEYPHVWDLGSAWQDWTGLPFIFGVWIVSRRSALENPAGVASACKALVQGKNWSAQRMDVIAGLAAGIGGYDTEAMRIYFNGLVYDMGEREKQGLRLFFRFLEEEGIISKAPELEFLELE